MDQKTKKLLEQKARHLAPKWMETGLNGERDRFFGLFTKKQMSIVLLCTLGLAAIADLGIFYQLFLSIK